MERAESIWRPLGELLVEKKLLTEDELELALTEQAESGRLLGAILVERGYVSGPALAIALAEQYGVELHTERGFGTGLWAEIDRRHRAGRGARNRRTTSSSSRPSRRRSSRSSPTPRADPELERLEAENRRLQDEIERLRGEFTKLKLVETPAEAASHLLFVPTPARYLLVERDGAPPQPGSTARARGRRLRRGQARRRAVPGRRPPVRVPPAARLGAVARRAAAGSRSRSARSRGTGRALEAVRSLTVFSSRGTILPGSGGFVCGSVRRSGCLRLPERSSRLKKSVELSFFWPLAGGKKISTLSIGCAYSIV